jgi:hypothetical protein
MVRGWDIGTKTSGGARVRVTEGIVVGDAVGCSGDGPETLVGTTVPVPTAGVGDFVPVS